MPHIHMLQLIETLRSVTNDIPDILNILQDLQGESSHFQVLM